MSKDNKKNSTKRSRSSSQGSFRRSTKEADTNSTPEKIQFKVDHIDPLGQGVSKLGDKITFIPKTLPGEEGICEINHKKKSIQFASLKELQTSSSDRVESECPHFQECPSCHFLHTSYQKELEFKFKSFQFELKRLSFEKEYTSIGCEKRYAYRNRIQLHYNLKSKEIGYIDAKSKNIIAVKNCQIPLKIIQEKIQEIYNNDFLNFPKGPAKGHLELYYDSNKNNVELAFNKPYAHLGFSQINQEMNEKAIDQISQFIQPKLNQNTMILDLFGGQGNLSKHFISELSDHEKSSIIVVDRYRQVPKAPYLQFIDLDLFKNDSHHILQKEADISLVDIMIIDPPRSGFKNIRDFIETFNPKYIVYMSCKVSTLERDLQYFEDLYQFKNAIMLDFFPGSYHYEGLVFAERK